MLAQASGHTPEMDIDDTIGGRKLRHVELRLTEAEARELRDSLESLLSDPFPDRHEHVSSSDFQTEITVYLTP
jgi:hypothetical protein